MIKYLPKTEFIWGTEFNKALKIFNELDKTKRVEKFWWDNNN
jgi:hypothetical protein